MPTPNPAWRAVVDDLRQRIAAGEWAPGERLPSTRQLTEHYQLKSHGTVTRALSALIAAGELITNPKAPRQGVTVRARPKVTRDLLVGTRYAANGTEGTFEAHTNTHDVTVDVDFAIVAPPDEVREKLGLGEKDRVLRRIFRYSIQGTPHQVMTSWMSTQIAAAAGLHIPEDEVPGKSTRAWLKEAGVKITRTRLRLEARMPTPEEIEALSLPNEQIPVIVRSGTIFGPDYPVAVETSAVLVVADQVAYETDIEEDDEESTC
ncbi:GntR family transcriptional regulator [Nocardia neocaledoniensis]|uniref:GntR family transcriptional regulator n=1 Tax=Nocardia neocaledoniensis TaxID=236511 RepID=UPI0033C920F6